MPRLNLKDDSLDSEPESGDSEPGSPLPPLLRGEDEGGRGGLSPLLWILLGIVVVGGIVFALNQFNVIHLWGSRPEAVSDAMLDAGLPPPEETPAEGSMQAESGQEVTPSMPIPETSREPAVTSPGAGQPASAQPLKEGAASLPPTGTGNLTVQMSAWETRAKADQEAAKLTAAGYPAYVVEGIVEGETWYRVRVGRYGRMADAQSALRQLAMIAESDPWIAQN